MNICPKYVWVSSCCNYRPFEVCEFPIARHRPYISMYCDTMDRVGKMRGQELARDHGLATDHGLVHEISGCLFKQDVFHKSNLCSGAE